jgi:hypothetical protein
MYLWTNSGILQRRLVIYNRWQITVQPQSMNMIRFCCFALCCFLLLIVPNVTLAQNPETAKDCPYEAFGICDPFVPGTIISPDGYVYDVWSFGPAEQAGICPGDKIIQVNEKPFNLKDLVGTAASIIQLRVKRINEEFDRKVERVRESELRIFSGIKELHVESGIRKVPIYQDPEELPSIRLAIPGSDSKSWSMLSGIREVPIYQDPKELPPILLAMPGSDSRSWSMLKKTIEGNSKDYYFIGLRLIRLDEIKNFLIENIDYPSPAYDERLQVGDLVLTISGKDTKEMTSEEIAKVLQPATKKTMLFEVMRKKNIVRVSITPAKKSESLAKIGRKVTACGPIPINCTCSR